MLFTLVLLCARESLHVLLLSAELATELAGKLQVPPASCLSPRMGDRKVADGVVQVQGSDFFLSSIED